MRAMKGSGIPWIGEIPEEWEVRKLKYLFYLSSGLTITKADLMEGGLPCISYGDIHSRYTFDLNLEYHKLPYIDSSYYDSKPNCIVRNGDFVFCDTSEDLTGAGNCVLIQESLNEALFAGSHTIIARNQILNCSRFFAYYFASLKWRNQIRSVVTGTKVYTISQAILKNTYIILPSYKVQQAIANYLDSKTQQIDATVKREKRHIEKLKQYRQSLISETVTRGLDPSVPMRDSGIPWIGEIPEGWDKCKIKYLLLMKSGDFIEGEKIKEIAHYPVYGGNGHRGYSEEYTHDGEYLLIGRQGALCGNVRRASGKFYATEHAITAITINKICLNFYYYTLIAANLNQYSTSAAQPGLAVSQIANLFVCSPPLPEQQAIADYLDRKTAQINAVLAQKETLIKKLLEYKKSLIYEAVTGKLAIEINE